MARISFAFVCQVGLGGILQTTETAGACGLPEIVEFLNYVPANPKDERSGLGTPLHCSNMDHQTTGFVKGFSLARDEMGVLFCQCVPSPMPEPEWPGRPFRPEPSVPWFLGAGAPGREARRAGSGSPRASSAWASVGRDSATCPRAEPSGNRDTEGPSKEAAETGPVLAPLRPANGGPNRVLKLVDLYILGVGPRQLLTYQLYL